MVKLTSISYQESRLEYFREQLKHAERVLDWWTANSPDPYVCAEKGEIVSFYQDVVKMLEEGIKNGNV